MKCTPEERYSQNEQVVWRIGTKPLFYPNKNVKMLVHTRSLGSYDLFDKICQTESLDH